MTKTLVVVVYFQLTHSFECDPTKIGLPVFASIVSIIAHALDA